jgi:DNA-binding transcriptional LysR family regulator
MDLRALRIFTEVIRQGGFSQAGKTVFLTQSAVSKAVRQLEGELGFTLIDRSGSGPVLTDAGRVALRHAHTLLAQRDDFLAELGELKGLTRGILRLGLPPVGSDILFAPIFAVYRTRHPEIEIQLVEHGSRRLEEMVLSGDVDLGASLLPVPEALEWQEVTREPLHVLIREDHPLAGQPEIALAQLKTEALVLFDSGFALNPIILKGCRDAGFDPAVAARSGQINFIVELVASGLGIGFLPRLIADLRVRPGVVHLPVHSPAMNWHMAWVWRRGSYLSFAAKAWLELAREITTKAAASPGRGSGKHP